MFKRLSWWVVTRIVNVVERGLERNNVGGTLRGFLPSMVGILLKSLLLISVASMIGIETTLFMGQQVWP